MSHNLDFPPSCSHPSAAPFRVRHGKDRSDRPPGRVQADDSMLQDGDVGDGHHGGCHSCIDPQQLIRCPASSYCCSTQCGPPCKRRATAQEVDSIAKPGPSQLSRKSDDALWETFCSGACEDVICTSPGSVSCSGDDHCEAQNACFDPDCEGAPCFERNCSSTTCTEPSCPDNNCASDACWDENCSLEFPWHSCSLSHSAFHGDCTHYDEKWPSAESSQANQQGLGHQHMHDLRFNDSYDPNQISQHGIHDTDGALMSLPIYHDISTSGYFKVEHDQLFAAAGLADLHHTTPLSLESHSSTNGIVMQYNQPSNYPGKRPQSQRRVRTYSGTLDSDIFSTQSNNSSTPATTTSSGTPPSMPSAHQSPAWPVHSPSNGHSRIAKESQLSPESFSVDGMKEGMETISESASLSLPRQPSFLEDVQTKPGEEFVCKWAELDGANPVVCNHVCKDSWDLQIHIRDEHLTNKLEQYRCQWVGCSNGNDFKLRSKLERHMQTHTKHRPHQCEWPDCGKSFGTKQTLDNHLKTHTQLKPYKCRFCSATATTQTQIKTHENSVHEKKKLFPCRFEGCKHVATDSSNLSKHEKTHKEWARTFFCPEPGCTYKPDCRWENLKRHWIKSGHCAAILSNPELQAVFRDQCNEAAKRDDFVGVGLVEKPPSAKKRPRES